jgi:putative salt-induced outer membrane protein YdiY
MKMIKAIVVAAGMLAASSLTASAQTNVLTVTNVVTVQVTNVVTVTNMAARVPALALVAVPVPAAPDKNAWKSSVSASLTLTRGNSQSLLFTADFLTEKKTAKDEYSLGAGVAFGNQSSLESISYKTNNYAFTTSKDTVNDYKAFSQWNHLFTDNFFGYLRANALRDIISDIDYRLTIGPGAGYYLIKQTNTTLAVEGGFNFEAQKLGGEDQNFATVRLAERFEHKFNNRARFWQNVELLPQVDKLENYVMNFEIGIEAALSKSFNLKTYLDDTYANRPAAGRQQNDVKLVSGISYKF